MGSRITSLQGFAGIKILGQQNTSVSGAADVNENTLYSLLIKGGTVGANDSLRITRIEQYTNSVNNKTWRVKLGATAIRTFIATTSDRDVEQIILSNRNSVSSQIGPGTSVGTIIGSALGTAPSTYAIDFSTDQTLTVTAQKASAGETMTLEQVLVELIKAA
jgi:hypothetical protein